MNLHTDSFYTSAAQDEEKSRFNSDFSSIDSKSRTAANRFYNNSSRTRTCYKRMNTLRAID